MAQDSNFLTVSEIDRQYSWLSPGNIMSDLTLGFDRKHSKLQQCPDLFPHTGIESATTCLSGFNYPNTERFALRRFLDGEHITQVEFEAELSGFLEFMRKLRRALPDRKNN